MVCVKKLRVKQKGKVTLLVTLCLGGVLVCENASAGDSTPVTCPAGTTEDSYCYNPDSGGAPSSTAPSGYVSVEIDPVVGDQSLGTWDTITFDLDCPSTTVVEDWGVYMSGSGSAIECSSGCDSATSYDSCNLTCTNWGSTGDVNINSFDCLIS
jgi:hypothetical protein